MIGFCVLFALGVSYIAYNGINGSTGVNIAVNVIQISALIVFSVIAIGYRTSHNKDNDPGLYYASTSKAVPYQVKQENVQDKDADGKPKVDKDGKPVYVQDTWSDDAKTPKVDDKNQPIYKQADKIITDDDLKSKDFPLPASYDSKGFGKVTIVSGDPFPDYEVDKDGKPVLGKDGKLQPMDFVMSYAGSDAMGPGGRRSPTASPTTPKIRRSSITIRQRPR